MKRNLASLVFSIFAAALASTCHADTFGSGSSAFEIDFVPIINPDGPAGQHSNGRLGGILPGNAPDAYGLGSVAYHYRIGKYEVSESMIDRANAEGGLGLTHDGRGPNKPATSITWFEAAKFVNWLNTSTGSIAAYKFDASDNFQLWEPTDAGYDPQNLFRNRLAKYFLPSADEWCKAAYYDPYTPTGTWNVYPTGSAGLPIPVASGTAPGTAVFLQGLDAGPADIMQAGGLSPYGTMGQGGNVEEWEETSFDLINNSPIDSRGRRGGAWETFASTFSSSTRFGGSPAIALTATGVRIASVVPEPSSAVLLVSWIALVLGKRKSRSTD